MHLGVVVRDVHIFEVVVQRHGPSARRVSLVERPLGPGVEALEDFRNVAGSLVGAATLAFFAGKGVSKLSSWEGKTDGDWEQHTAITAIAVTTKDVARANTTAAGSLCASIPAYA